MSEKVNQAKTLMSIGQYDKALEYLKRAEEENNQQVEVYIQEGICLVNLDRLDEAEKAIKKVLQMMRNH